MIMLKKVRLIDPASRTDGIRDILISEGKINLDILKKFMQEVGLL